MRPLRPLTPLRRSLRASTWEGLFTEVWSACAGPTILVGWALHLGASPLEVAVVGALPQVAQVVQLPAAWASALLGNRRVALVTVAASRQVLLPLALVPILALPPAVSRALLVLVAALSAALATAGNNAWTAWMGELVPRAVRGRYFGRRTAVCVAAGTLAALATARLLDGAAGSAAAGHALALLTVFASLVGATTTVLMARQHEPRGPSTPPPTLSCALRPIRDADARGFLAYQVAWNASVGLAGGFFTFHLLSNLRVGFTVVALHAAAGASAKILSAPAWGRAVDRFGARPVLAASSFALSALPLLWLGARPDLLWPIAIDAVVGGIAWGGHGLAAFATPLAIAPRTGRAFYLAAFALAGGGAYALATAAGGGLATALPAAITGLGPGGHGLELLFLLSAAGRFASAFLALRIAERGAGSLADLHGAARAGARAAFVAVRVRTLSLF